MTSWVQAPEDDSTLPVTLEQMEYHVGMVARGAEKALIVDDLPFGSYQVSPEIAFSNAARLMAAGEPAGDGSRGCKS